MNSSLNNKDTYKIKSDIIPIIQNKEHSLTNNVIDPAYMSPPNSFMNKLQQRFDNYYSPKSKSSPNSFTFNTSICTK